MPADMMPLKMLPLDREAIRVMAQKHKGEVFWSQMQSRLCDHRGQHGGDRHRAHGADEGSGHADAHALLAHPFWVMG